MIGLVARIIEDLSEVPDDYILLVVLVGIGLQYNNGWPFHITQCMGDKGWVQIFQYD